MTPTLKNLSIRAKLLLGFGLMLVLMIVFGAVAVERVTLLQSTLALSRAKELQLDGAKEALAKLRGNLQQFLEHPDADSRKKIIDAEEGLAKAFDDNLKQYGASPDLSETEVAGHQTLTDAFTKYKQRRPQLFQFIGEGKLDEANAWRKEYSTPLEAAVEEALTHMTDVNDAARDVVATIVHRLGLLIAGMAGAMVLLGVGVAVYVYRSINQPLRQLRAVIDQVASGDFTARVRLDSGDELGRLGGSFDKLLDDRVAALADAQHENERMNDSVINVLQAVNLMSQRDLTARAPVTQDLIGTVSDSINALTDETSKVLLGVTDIAGQVQQVSGKVKQQADMVSRTAQDERESVNRMIDSLDEATRSMKNVANLADESNRSAAQATQVTDTALETVNGTVKGMEAIRETIAETEKRIKRLGERSQEISGIVNLINTISERTHVLALNASMQAAVAGEAGRGFAVVAEEVQRLAESSRNASQQIGALVGNIQLETNETISTVNRTIGQVVHGSEQAQKAGEQMRRTQEITGQLVAQVRRIAESSEQQKEMSANLLQSVRHIGQSTERTAQQIVAQNHETETLLDSARRLVESVSVFKLPRIA